jgi:DHA3 family macrolide efflux protein-like MFS transporter
MSDSAKQQSSPCASMRIFTIFFGGQSVSMLASGITNFALTIWLLRNTDSVTDYALMFVAAFLPRILLSPLAGVIVDRFPRKAVLILSDTAAIVTTALVAYLYLQGNLELWHIYLVSAIDSAAMAFQAPAAMAAISLMVPKKSLPMVSGLNQISMALVSIVAPVLAAALIPLIDISGIFIIDIVTFIFAITTLAFIRIPEPQKITEQVSSDSRIKQFIGDSKAGWHYLRQRKELSHIMLYGIIVNFSFSILGVTMLPLLNHFTNETELGVLMSAVGVGALLGGVGTMIIGNRVQSKVRLSLMTLSLVSGCLFLMAMRQSLWLIGLGLFLANLLVPIANGMMLVLWQTKIPPELQGRVFSTRMMINQSVALMTALMAGPIIDKVLAPFFQNNSSAAQALEKLVGTNAGQGIGLMLMICSLVLLIASIWAYANPNIRHIETRLPDMLPDEKV